MFPVTFEASSLVIYIYKIVVSLVFDNYTHVYIFFHWQSREAKIFNNAFLSFYHFYEFFLKGLIDTWLAYLPISYAWLLSLLRIRIARSVKKQCRDKQASYSMAFWGHTLFCFFYFSIGKVSQNWKNWNHNKY